MKFQHMPGLIAIVFVLSLHFSTVPAASPAGDSLSARSGDAASAVSSQSGHSGQSSAALVASYGEKFRKVPTGDRKLIVLSFDDGPHPTRTAQVMSILKENNIPANFFLIGRNVRQYPEVARQVADAGYEIGNHSMNHPNLRKQSLATVRQEIGETQTLIEEATGRRPHLFRPPGGFVDSEVQKVCLENELAISLWSVDPKDWAQGSTPQSIHDLVMRTAHSGAIVCMHDIKANTVTALPGIIRDLKAKGYEFTTISQLLEARDESIPMDAGEVAGNMGDGGMDLSSPLTISLEESDI